MDRLITFYVDSVRGDQDSFRANAPLEWEVYTFSEGFTALQSLEKTRPSLLVVDVLMEGIYGVDLLLAAKKILYDINTVFVSVFSKDEIQKKLGKDLGDVPFFRKPLSKDFFASIAHFVKPHKEFEINLSATMVGYLGEYENRIKELQKQSGILDPELYASTFNELVAKYKKILDLSEQENEDLLAKWRQRR